MPNYNYPYAPQYYPTQSNAFPTQSNAFPANMNVGPTQSTQNPPQIQNGGFVPAPNEDFARNYPVAIGTSVTFKDETTPYIYVKTMGFSQLDRPVFEKYRLEKEDTSEKREEKGNTEIDSIRSDITRIWGELNEIKESRKNTPKRENKVGES